MGKENCIICGEPMPEGEEMFKFHGYSGPCPKQPMELKEIQDPVVRAMLKARELGVKILASDCEAVLKAAHEAELTQLRAQLAEAQEVNRKQATVIAALVHAIELGLEYWRHRQMRYKNRHPVWVEVATDALALTKDKP